MATTVYRLLGEPPENVKKGSTADLYGTVEKGGLCFSVREYEGEPLLAPSPGGWGTQFKMPPDQIERYEFGQPQAKDFWPLLRYYLAGKAVLPNFEPCSVEHGLNAIASGGGMREAPGGVQNILLPGSRDGHTVWARAFVTFTQGGQFTGSGYVIWYRGMGAGHMPKEVSQIARFALCQHEKRDGPGANHMRGWHPGCCTKCALDMTVDSSD